MKALQSTLSQSLKISHRLRLTSKPDIHWYRVLRTIPVEQDFAIFSLKVQIYWTMLMSTPANLMSTPAMRAGLLGNCPTAMPVKAIAAISRAVVKMCPHGFNYHSSHEQGLRVGREFAARELNTDRWGIARDPDGPCSCQSTFWPRSAISAQVP